MPTIAKVNAIYFLLLLSMSTYSGISKDSRFCKTDTIGKSQPQNSGGKGSKTATIEITQNFEDKNFDILETSLIAALDEVREAKKSSSRPNNQNIILKTYDKVMKAAHNCNHFNSEIYATPIFLLIPVTDTDNTFSQIAIIEEVKGLSLFTLTTNRIKKGIDSRLNDHWKEAGITGMLSKETHNKIADGTLRPMTLESVNQLPKHLNLKELQKTLHEGGYHNITIDLSSDDKTKLPD